MKSLLVLLFLFSSLFFIASQAHAASGTPAFAMDFSDGTTTDSDLQFIASHYNLFVADGSDYYNSKVSYLHRLNPSLTVLVYLNGVSVTRGTSEYDYINSNHPDWFLKDASGNRVYEVNWPANYVLNPANPGWQQYRAAQGRDLINTYGYDGSYFDRMSAYFCVGQGGYSAQPINPATRQPYTNTEWRDSVKQYLTVIKQTIGTGKLSMFNGPGTGYHYYLYGTDQLVSEADGTIIEGFMRWPTNPGDYYKSEDFWRKDVDLVAELEQKGKTSMVLTSVGGTTVTEEQKQSQHMYSFTSYLLGKGSKSLFAFWTSDTDRYKYFDNLWQAQIGDPTGAYFKLDGVYQRSFTAARVLVNPSATTTYTVNLGSAYKTADSRIVNTVILPPHTGMLLLKDPSLPAPTITGSVSINGENYYTTTQNVTLSLVVSDPSLVDQVMISNDASFTGASWVPFSDTKSWWLASGDGTKTVYVKFKDKAGNVTGTYSDTILLATVSITGSVSINSGANYTTTRQVTLSLSATDALPSTSIAYVIISNDPLFTGSSWVPYATQKAWWLAAGDGNKTVYVKFKDTSGNISGVYSDGIILDSVAPTGSVLINNGISATSNRQVILSLPTTDPSAGSGVAYVIISNDASFAGASWIPYASSKTWWLTDGIGTKAVYIRYKDKAGNTSVVYSDTIYYAP